MTDPTAYMKRAQAARRRAPAMSSQDRRAAIIEATLPLLVEHGMNVTTSQIAAAAGIAEGTVFRAFGDKQELITACIQQVMRAEDGLAAIRAVPAELSLAERLTRVGGGMARRMREVGRLMHSLMATGYKPEQLKEKAGIDREKWIRESTDALVDVIGPDADALRLPAQRAAQVFFGLVFSTQFADRAEDPHSEPGRFDIEQLVEVFLHGVQEKSQGEPQ